MLLHRIADAMFTPDAPMFAAVVVFGGMWTLALNIQMARKIDPIYGRAAGTAVIPA